MSETFTFYIQPWYRKSPYFEATKRAGCASWGLYNHMLLPTLYDDPVTEYWALLRDVTMWDVSVERCVEISGAGRAPVHEPPHVSGPHLVRGGAVQVRPRHGSRRRHRERSGPAAHSPRIGSGSRSRTPMRSSTSRAWRPSPGWTSVIEEADVSPMQVQGPRSKGRRARRRRRRGRCAPVLPVRRGRDRRYPGRRLPDGVDGRGGLRALPLRHVTRRRAVAPRGGGRRAVRDPRDRSFGGAADRGGDLQLRVRHAHGGHAVPRHRARAARRARAGRRLHREGRVAPDRGGGRRSEARRDRHRRRADERRGRLERLLAGPRAGRGPGIGRVTAGAWSPRLERNIGYAWVPATHIAVGTALALHAHDGTREATVATLPFVDPTKEIPKS